MIYKRCARCGGRVPSGERCECESKNIRTYTKAEGIKKEYHTQRWKELREYVMNKYGRIDLYALHKYHRVVLADTAHHIETTHDRPDLFYSSDNLIPVSRVSHTEIHNRYKGEDKGKVQTELRDFLGQKV